VFWGGNGSLWWHWTAPEDGFYTLNTVAPEAAVRTSIYTGTNLANLLLIAETHRWAEFDAENNLTWRASAGTNYHFRISGWPELLKKRFQARFTLLLREAPLEPLITGQPESRRAVANGPLLLSVRATGAELLEYQWFLNGELLPGAIRPELSLSHIQPEEAGAYSVEVRNPFGRVTSSPAVVEVLAPRLLSLLPESLRWIEGRGFQFEITDTNYSTVIVERSGDLEHWQPLRTNILWGGTVMNVFDEKAATEPASFYRLRSP
jgi:hypothetical protein